MMEDVLTALIRPAEIRTAELQGNSLEEIQTAAAAQCPSGFQLAAAPVRMVKGSTALTATATYQRVGGQREMEADDRTSLEAKLPAGWQILSVRAV